MIIRLHDVDVDFPLGRGEKGPLVDPQLLQERIRGQDSNCGVEIVRPRRFEGGAGRRKLRYLLHAGAKELLEHAHDARLLPRARRAVEQSVREICRNLSPRRAKASAVAHEQQARASASAEPNARVPSIASIILDGNAAHRGSSGDACPRAAIQSTFSESKKCSLTQETRRFSAVFSGVAKEKWDRIREKY